MQQGQDKCSNKDDDRDDGRSVSGFRQVNDSNHGVDAALFRQLKRSLGGYFLLSIYLALLIIPLYAIVMSAIRQDWLMMIVDILLIPVGFIHGILMLFGVV